MFRLALRAAALVLIAVLAVAACGFPWQEDSATGGGSDAASAQAGPPAQEQATNSVTAGDADRPSIPSAEAPTTGEALGEQATGSESAGDVDPTPTPPAEPSPTGEALGEQATDPIAAGDTDRPSSPSADPPATSEALGAFAETTCAVTPSQTEGPFYFDIGELRRDIVEGRPGTPLRVLLRLVEADSCEPIRDARVDIWHTDAAGQYSGYPGQGDDRSDTSGETFLRGAQITDADGLVEFETIYPGWYPGRTVHIHFKALEDERRLIASQMYFPDDVTDTVFMAEPYSARPARGTTNANDGIFASNPALMGHVTRSEAGYVVSLTIAVAR